MSIIDEVARLGVVPVIETDRVETALPLVDALAEGGLPVAEITFRTPAAAEAVATIARQRPNILLGAGTVLTAEQLSIASEAGARFCLSPGLDSQILQKAHDLGMPFIPGVMTPSDMIAGINAGCRMFKFFPASAAGGPAMLKSIAAPFRHLELGFNPTGGIGIGALSDWLSIESVRAVGGTWIATRSAIASRDWEQITKNAKEAVEATEKAR